MARVETIGSTQLLPEAPKKVMPLSFVPEAKNRFPSSELTSVAGHELNHALVALAHGESVVSVSVVPEGNSLGRTILGGLVSQETMKVIAAGGGVDTHDGHAEGFGSDKFKVDVAHYYRGGHSWESAKSQATDIVSKYSNKVRRIASEIIAYLRNVSGSMIGDIMLRAQMEADQEEGITRDYDMRDLKQENKFEEGYTIIDDLPGNMQKITYIIVGKKDKEELLCGVCLGINSHMEKCSNIRVKEKKEENPFALPHLIIPREGTIFPN